MLKAKFKTGESHGGHGGPLSIKSWILAARPKTLPAAIVPVWLGSMPAIFMLYGDGFSGLLFFCTLVSCLCIQVATNLFNDAIDHDKGADTGDRLGPVRATASGLLSRRAVLLGALAFCAAAAAVAIPLIQARGWPIIAIGSFSLLMAFAYTGGPFPLAYRGLGEVFVIAFFGFVTVCGSFFVQTGHLPLDGPSWLWLLSLQVGCYSSVLIAINNLRDVEEDTRSGKRTLAVRFGKRFARCEIAVFCWAPLLINLMWIEQEEWLMALLPWILAPLALVITLKVFRTEPGRIYNKFLAMAALQLLLFGFLYSLVWMVES